MGTTASRCRRVELWPESDNADGKERSTAGMVESRGGERAKAGKGKEKGGEGNAMAVRKGREE